MFKTTPILHSITIQSDNHKSTRGDWMLHAVIYFLSFSFFSFQLYEIVSRYRVTICIHEIGLQDLSTEQPESRITWARIAVDRSWKNSWMFLRLSKISHNKYCMWKQQLNPATAAGQPSRGIVWFFYFYFFCFGMFFPPNIFIVQALVLDIPSGLLGWSSECRHLLHPYASPSMVFHRYITIYSVQTEVCS